MERVTDSAEEEIQGSSLETTMTVILDRWSRGQKANQEWEKDLAKVTIKKEDLQLIMTEMEISREAAELELEGTHGPRGRGADCPNPVVLSQTYPLD
ncbi:huntingtin-interacting protein K [Camelus ferus]|nr:huntingtin-interacting protein K [Camelus ferus]